MQVKDLLMKMYNSLYKGKDNKENKVEKFEESRQQNDERKPNYFDKKRFNGLTEEQEKMLNERDKQKEQEKKFEKEDDLEDFDDDYNDDLWGFNDNKKKQNEVKPMEIKKEDPKKSNPFDQKVKPAFDDLDEIGFEMDSDRDKKK